MIITKICTFANLIFSIHDIVYVRIVRTVNLLIRKVRDPYGMYCK